MPFGNFNTESRWDCSKANFAADSSTLASPVNSRTALRLRLAVWLLTLLLLAPCVQAVIFRDTGDPTHNTSAPTGALTNSGWQYEGQWQNIFLGTPIAPNYFLSAQHIGGSVGNVFTWNGTNYATTAYFNSPDSDLRLWQVAQTFPCYAPLYTNLNAAGQFVVIIGRGTQRGAPVVVNGATNGWYWGASDYVQRWGENTVTASYDPYLYALFSETGPTNECAVSTGDSAGAWFIQQGGVWALAGITYASDGPFSTNCSTFPNNLSMLDERGLCDPGYYAANYPVAVPSGFIASSVPNDLFWINSVIQPGGNVMTPITVSNFFNANEVVGTSTPLTATMFRGIYPQPDSDWAWYASGTPGLPAGGLPMGTTIKSLAFTNTTFAFQPATATNNTAIISLNGSPNPTNLTLTLSGTTAYAELAFWAPTPVAATPPTRLTPSITRAAAPSLDFSLSITWATPRVGLWRMNPVRIMPSAAALTATWAMTLRFAR